jgi:putative peptide zinc metalloprotease protein
VTTLVDAPARVDGVQLIGEMAGSGYRTPPSLVRRGDGQVLQLTPLLYLVLQAADGRRSCADIAEVVGARLGRPMDAAAVTMLVDKHLRPLGLVKGVDGSVPELKRTDPLLGLKFRVAVTDPRTTRRLTDPFRFLFRPVVAVPVFAVFVAVVAWVFFERGLGASAYDALQRPHLLLLVFVVSVLSGGFHEFGHAAAARYGGAEPGVMGAGLYVVWPAFYTDVTDSYRLGRAGRIRADLGGLYFNAIVVVLTFVWWWATGWEALLLLVATQVLQMTQQLLPLLRFDGYHLLADVAGVPDLYQRIRPTLTGLLPHRWRSQENRVLKPGARALITAWVLVTVPMMVLMLLALVSAVPRLVASAGSVVEKDLQALGDAWGSGDVLGVGGHLVQTLGVVLPVLACAVILGRLAFRSLQGLARWSRDSLGRRVLAAALTAAVVTVLSWSWWPNPGTYRPLEPGDQQLVANLLPGTQSSAAGAPRVAADAGSSSEALPIGAAARARLGNGEPLVATFEEGEPLPTEAEPVLSLVLVPSEEDDASAGSEETDSPGAQPTTTAQPDPTATAAPDGQDGTWVFPFDKPLLPEEGDNQSLAVNTRDGSVIYDVAFALVWAEGDEVLNVNEAHAYASCSDCVAVAVAFQVVLIMDDAQVIAPQNLAVAANYECYRCITAAIANQLVLSLPGEPAEEQLRALGEVWGRLLELAGTITSRTLDDVATQLESFKAEIAGIFAEAPVVQPAPTSGADPTSAPDDADPDAVEPSPTGSASPSPSRTTEPSEDVTSPPPSSAPPSPSTAPTTEDPSVDPSPSAPTSDAGSPSSSAAP